MHAHVTDLHVGVEQEEPVHADERDADDLAEAEARGAEHEQREDEHEQQQEAELGVRHERHDAQVQVQLWGESRRVRDMRDGET